MYGTGNHFSQHAVFDASSYVSDLEAKPLLLLKFTANNLVSCKSNFTK